MSRTLHPNFKPKSNFSYSLSLEATFRKLGMSEGPLHPRVPDTTSQGKHSYSSSIKAEWYVISNDTEMFWMYQIGDKSGPVSFSKFHVVI